MSNSIKTLFILAAFVLISAVSFTPSTSYAQEVGTCTDQPQYVIDNRPSQARNGLMYRVATRIVTTLRGTAGNVFTSIAGSRIYIGVATAAVIVSLVFYATLFMLGIVQASFHDAFWRVFKMGLIFTMLHPRGWTFFSVYIVSFFEGGTSDLVFLAATVAFDPLHGITGLAAPTQIERMVEPMVLFTNGINLLLSAKMMIALIALPFTGPYGLIIFLLFIWGITTFIMAVLQSVWIYLMAIIAKTLLYGLAPLFFLFILFDRTKPLFMGWLSQLIHYSLQPILLFMFFGFFMMLLEASLEKILRVRLCWEPFMKVPALPMDWHFWRFKTASTPLGPDSFGRYFSWDTPFPILITDVLIFIIIAQLSFRYVSVVLHIAKEISGGVVYLNQMPGTIQQWARSLNNAATGAGKKVIQSDIRVKTDIVKVGELNGINLYEFGYKGREGRFRGVIAQEVQHIKGAVVKVKGIKCVNYQQLGISFAQIG